MKRFIVTLALLFTGCTWDKASVIEDEEIIQEITNQAMDLKSVKENKDGQKDQETPKDHEKSPEAGKVPLKRGHKA